MDRLCLIYSICGALCLHGRGGLAYDTTIDGTKHILLKHDVSMIGKGEPHVDFPQARLRKWREAVLDGLSDLEQKHLRAVGWPNALNSLLFC